MAAVPIKGGTAQPILIQLFSLQERLQVLFFSAVFWIHWHYVPWKTKMSGKVLLLFMLIGAMYFGAEAQGGEYTCIRHSVVDTCSPCRNQQQNMLNCKHVSKYVYSTNLHCNFSAGLCHLSITCNLGFFPAGTYEECCFGSPSGNAFQPQYSAICLPWSVHFL